MSLPISKLIEAYKTDPDSTFHALRFHSRQNYNSLMTRLERDCGSTTVAEINARLMRRLHEGWVGPAKHIAMAHSLVGMLRTITTFGATILEDAECARLSAVLSKLRFKMARPRKLILTTEHVIEIIKTAHELGLPSIATAQAFQHACTFRQKDIIGEIVPATEPGPGILLPDGSKWMRGITWSEIDTALILRHTTSKKEKTVEIDLKLAPLVMAELDRIAKGPAPSPGPIIIFERTGQPYYNYQFRKEWRTVAKVARIPDNIRNMDTRAGAITEAFALGVNASDVRKQATHAQQSQTDNYNRGETEAIKNSLTTRGAEHARLMKGDEEQEAAA